VFAIIFLASVIFSWYKENDQYDKWQEFVGEKHKRLAEVDDGTMSERDVVFLLMEESSTQSYWDSYQLFREFSGLYMAIFLACLFCGLIEPRTEKKR